MVDVWSPCHICAAQRAKHSSWCDDRRLYLCCTCWVTQGHEPFDWHPGCSEPYGQRIQPAS